MADSNKKPFYGSQAYRPDNIPNQAPSSRASLYLARSIRLPWGNTQQTTSMNLFEESTPESMRFWENIAKEKEEKKANGTYVPAIFEGVELHSKCDNERYRFAPLPFTSQFGLIALQFGKGSLFIFFPISVITHLAAIYASHLSWQKVTIELLQGFYPVFVGCSGQL
ncbi:hypothetical protein, partial [Pseudomonas syringae group genomosp. 3]|uniref:hypothetical protein n=1 Tax=Pseudomonas syringae group genomosp. 3 TaxID=251701 RepID=UPI0021803D50